MRLNFEKHLSASSVVARIFFAANALFVICLFPNWHGAYAQEGQQDELVGVYTLTMVDGSVVPATVSHDGHEINVQSGTFTFNADRTCISKVLFGPPAGKPITREVKADYTRDGTELKMKWHGAGRTVGTLEGDKFSMNNEGMIFTYKKQTLPPPEDPQSVLDRFLGNWRSVHQQPPTDEDVTIELRYNRILGGRYVQERAEIAGGNKAVAMYTFDAERNCYRMWHFASEHSSSEAKGTWDPQAKTLTWNSVDSGQQVSAMTSKHHFVDDDKFEWEVVGKDENGKQLFHMQGKADRIAESDQ